MLIRLQKHHYDEIVIGGTLEALIHSYLYEVPLLINSVELPHRFEKHNFKSSLEIWNQLFFALSLKGLNLLGDKAASIRIREGEVVASTKNARVIKLTYDKATVFDDERVAGLPPPKRENNEFIVLDWITALSCEAHDYDYIKINDKLIDELHFYTTERMDGNHPRIKDIVAISNLTKDELEDFEYSDTYAKFKTTSILKELGLRGKKCGGGKRRAMILEVEKREIKKAKMNFYEDLPNIKFKYGISEKLNNLLWENK